MPLSWSFLEHLDRSALDGFECARNFWWEVEVEQHVRDLDGVKPPEYVLVGLDSFGPAVVINYYVEESSCKILIVATAKRAQQQGYGSEAIRHVLGLLESGLYGTVDEVWGMIHRFNTRSKAMMRECGFDLDDAVDDFFEVWARSIGPNP